MLRGVVNYARSAVTPNVRHAVPGAIRLSGEVQFGAFTLDLDTRELRRGGDSVPLSPKAFLLLEALVENHPRALSKATLQKHLWPNTVVVEKNLANLVTEVRHALGDVQGQSQFVRTVRRFGYSFCGTLEYRSSRRNRLAAARFRLTWSEGSADLVEGAFVLGRDANAELVFSSPGVSRRHARIFVEDAIVTVEDLGSKNGTFVAGRRIDARTTIAAGDTIRIGSVELSIRALAEGVTETL